MPQSTIKTITARYILDSRGNPTVEADVILNNGIIGRASVPSGASKGDKEALELRDGNTEWCGKGVNKAITNIQNHISPRLEGKSPYDIQHLDDLMIQLDGTENKSNLGNLKTYSVELLDNPTPPSDQ